MKNPFQPTPPAGDNRILRLRQDTRIAIVSRSRLDSTLCHHRTESHQTRCPIWAKSGKARKEHNRVTGPTFRPKPRRIPRMLNSTSISRPRSCLRATNSARTSCDLIDLACTGRNQPIRISWASPRASLRSVFIVIADKAAFTCRVPSRTASNPARFSPACSHCDNGRLIVESEVWTHRPHGRPR
jgi:hypothetical protein